MSLQWSNQYPIQQSTSFNDGDKIILPASALQELLLAGNNQLPSPLTFQLRNPLNNATIHSGVKEFSNLTNQIQLPTWMAQSLDLADQGNVLISFKPLPKGTWTRLRPLSADYLEITDYRAALESHLRSHYTTLTTGQTITCRYGSRSYPFLVVDLKPDQAVGVTDTDLEVDLDPIGVIDPTTPSIPQSRINEAKLGTRQTAKVAQGQFVYWKLDVGTATGISITLKAQSGDVDLVVSSRPKPTLDNHDWSDLSSSEERTLAIGPLEEKVVWHNLQPKKGSLVRSNAAIARPGYLSAP
ncbi:ubiquitin fusion degradation protein UFD1-domain-containing protein [Phycomyces nitens]|nr:ubiquitin fusion degradation protein UFD1-domain-containing protein [Phycomyces nitens]